MRFSKINMALGLHVRHYVMACNRLNTISLLRHSGIYSSVTSVQVSSNFGDIVEL